MMKESDGPNKNHKAPGLPVITLPKGGGAIRGMGEKFAANPATGTGSMVVPIATSPGRSGFGPRLMLSYDSGAGNGPFGFGWTLSLPSITRKTDKGLPRYRDADDSDVFLLSGAEDLAAVYRQDVDGTWVAAHPGYQRDPLTFRVRDPDARLVIHEDELDGYRVRHYRPRIEGLFARIERWSKIGASSDVHWRSISRDNILTIYGFDRASRIFDPTNPSRIFAWLICETRDDRGNAMLYDYRAEDGSGVNLAHVHERNRGALNDIRRTANRYLKRIHYGNRRSLLDNNGRRPRFLTQAQIDSADWMFEVVFDYGEHDAAVPKPNDAGAWGYRPDPFSSYRAGFEVRTTRICQRVLMFHHFPEESGVGADCLVRSTDFTYSDEADPTDAVNPVYTFLQAVTQNGYRRNNHGYDKQSLPPVEFKYTIPVVQDRVEQVDAESLENLPIGLDGRAYRWNDLHGEGIPGILTEQAGAWFYKRNLSPLPEEPPGEQEDLKARFTAAETVALKPNLALAGGARFMDLAGDGLPDLVMLGGPVPGLYEHDDAEGWQTFRPFTSRLDYDMNDPNLRLVDLDGDSHADVLITEDDALVWYPSLAEEGFGPGLRIAQALDEEKGPRLIFAEDNQSIHLADLSGDGLTDLVRIRNGEVCYWPNLGYGRFGAKVTMDNAPRFDNQDQFDQQRIRLADIDGSGTTDIIYLHRDGIRLYFNQSGNSWSMPHVLNVFPRADDPVSIVPTDLLGNGTACLVWSSPLPGDARRPMRYANLMGGQKPHLLVRTTNNLGAETRVVYAPSTKFYLQDKRDGRPWITRLPFPVHVVERVETHDLISRNRFVTRYAYHHGYFDGEEREFRGFGMVEQYDTEELAALSAGGDFPDAVNIDAASYVPTVLTRTWFHTGVYPGGDRVSRHFEQEYYHEGDESEGAPGLTDDQLQAMLLPDTDLPTTLKRQDGFAVPWPLTTEETRQACRALKGTILRREIYALDGTDGEDRPYSATEQNYTIELLQPKGDDRYAVFFTHLRESIDFHYERKLVEVAGKKIADPRVTHVMTLEVDVYGSVLKSSAIGYGRRPGLSPLQGADRQKQERLHITYTENEVTHPIDEEDDYRTPLAAEARTYELLKTNPESNQPDITNLFRFDELAAKAGQAGDGSHDLAYEDVAAAGATTSHPYRRIIEQVRTLYRKDDLTGLLPLGEVEPLALPGESYKLAFTSGLLDQVYQRDGRPLLPNPADVLGGQGADRGGYVDLDGDSRWWIPAGKVFFDPGANVTSPASTAGQELSQARTHFFLPRLFADPFGNKLTVAYDSPHDLLVVTTADAVGNTATALNDYRVLATSRLTDPNGNRSAVSFDALGLVAGTALMGKAPPAPAEGDSLDGFVADLGQSDIDAFHEAADPHVTADGLLGDATTRVVYDVNRFYNSRLAEPGDPSKWKPAFAATLMRETHVHGAGGGAPKIQISFSYSDGFSREIQKKIQAEPGPLDIRDPQSPVANPRWVGSGWTIFNNKGKPVRRYEPFFSATHDFEFGITLGVSPVLFYDPVERVVATLHPNHTWEKVVFGPWQQETWDVNDTVLAGDPGTDPDVGEFFKRLPDADYLPTWQALRTDAANAAAFAAQYPDATDRSNETQAAQKTALHAATPRIVHADALGRTFVTVAHNCFKYSNSPPADPPVDAFYSTRFVYDIEGNQREVIDAKDRVVMRCDYDMLGNRTHQLSMEAGERWMLSDVAGKPLRGWNSRKYDFQSEYDVLRRPVRSYVQGGDPAESGAAVYAEPILFERTIYGDSADTGLTQAQRKQANLLGKVFKHCDSAGIVTTDLYDFKGNPLQSSREVANDYKSIIDWSASQPPGELFASSITYDALNRPVTVITPDKSVYSPTFNEANLLHTVDVNLQGAASATSFVTNIDYNAKGQRTLIRYGNGASTSYTHDPDTFRLTQLLTQRNPFTYPHDCPQQPPSGWPGCQVQNLHYTYDPAGNITFIRDDAQQTIFFKNQRVEPSNDYTYDAVYRLIEATGREHLGQVGGAPIAHSYNDAPRVGLAHPGDGKALGRYREQYQYDPVGNFLHFIHRGTDPANPGWTRDYAYQEASLLEPSKHSNRLSSTTIGATTETYSTGGNGYDAHGSMLKMPQLQIMQSDFKDQLQMTQRQAVNASDADGTLHQGERTYYVYGAAGQRARKVTERQNGTRMKERVYLGGFEVYREYGARGNNVVLERQTLHVMDDKQRIALVETKTINTANDDSPAQLVRYQFANHLGSASLELDDQGQVISYEEYTPYGSTSYQAVDRDIKAAAKRYRYTGMERDEESGLNYHRTRYYASWLGRWASCDPIGTSAGPNLFLYTKLNPVRMIDSNGTSPKKLPPDVTKFVDAVWAYFGKTAEISENSAPGIPGRGFIRSKIGKLAADVLREDLTPILGKDKFEVRYSKSSLTRIDISLKEVPVDIELKLTSRAVRARQLISMQVYAGENKRLLVIVKGDSPPIYENYTNRRFTQAELAQLRSITSKVQQKLSILSRSGKSGSQTNDEEDTGDSGGSQSGGRVAAIGEELLVNAISTVLVSLLLKHKLPSTKDLLLNSIPMSGVLQAKGENDVAVPLIIWGILQAAPKSPLVAIPLISTTAAVGQMDKAAFGYLHDVNKSYEFGRQFEKGNANVDDLIDNRVNISVLPKATQKEICDEMWREYGTGC